MKANKIFWFLVLGFIFVIVSLAGQASLGAEFVKIKKVYNIDFKKNPDTLKFFIDSSHGSIEVSSWNNLNCEVNVSYRVPVSTEDEAKKIAGQKTRVSYEKGELVVSLKEFFKFFERKGCSLKELFKGGAYPVASITIYAPKNIVYDLKADTSNGRITVNNLKCLNLKADTSNGKITLSNVSAKAVKADTSNGAIEFSGRANEVKLDTSNGAISVLVPADKDIGVKIEKADTSVGKVKVNLKDFLAQDKDTSYGPSSEIKGETKNFAHADYKIVISADTSVGSITIGTK